MEFIILKIVGGIFIDMERGGAYQKLEALY